MFYDEMKSFLDALKSRSKTDIPVREGMASLKVALAALESMETGQVIKIES